MKILFLIFLYSFSVYSSIEIQQVDLKCGDEVNCERILDIDTLKKVYESEDQFELIMSTLSSINGLRMFSYSVKGNKLSLFAKFEKRVKEVKIINAQTGEDLDIELELPLSVGHFWDETLVANSSTYIKDALNLMGYPNAIVKSSFVKKILSFKVYLKEPLIVDNILVESTSIFVRSMVSNILLSYKGELYNKQNIRDEISSLSLLLQQYGYYLADISLQEREATNGITLIVNVKNTDLYFLNQDIAVKQLDQKKIFKDLVISQQREPSVEVVISKYREDFQSIGYLNTKIVAKKKEYKNISGDNVTHYDVKVELGQRTRLKLIEFQGVSDAREKELRKFFFENASPVVSGGFLDEKYVLSYVDFIKKYYYEKGYVNVLLTQPIIRIKKNDAFVNYKIREGLIATIDSIKFTDINSALEYKLLKKMNLKKGNAFNPLQFQLALDSAIEYLDTHGYIFAQISNKNAPTLLRYKNSNSQVDIKIEFDNLTQYRMGNLFIVGKKDSRNKLIKREIGIAHNELLSTAKLDRARGRLLSLGLFSKVSFQKMPNDNGTLDLVTLLEEKDFGTIELSPGIRSDLGARLAFDLSYNNLEGMNKRISFKGAVNQRFDLKTLDEVRRVESNSLVEYDLAVNYFENHLFDTDFNFSTSVSTLRRRFFSFDADIDKVGYTLSKQFTDVFSASLSQQLEIISQFEASDTINNGNFQIGSVTPGVRFDFRDSSIVPTKGAWFDLTCEFANPTFLSQSNEELTINYYKLMSQNKFYFPFNNGVFAISMAMGVQQNIAGDSSLNSYIPNIKVFRLSGNDIVRGYEDEEINKLPDQIDISEVQVTDKAYMGAIKIEPRFFLSDSTMIGVFYDAGRISVDPIDINNFRSSVGLSFKYLTPVGSINFDYGIKLLRKRLSNGNFETPGRLHVSIGFF